MQSGPARDCYVKAMFTGVFGSTCYEQVSPLMTRAEAEAEAFNIQQSKSAGLLPHVKAIQVIGLRLAV